MVEAVPKHAILSPHPSFGVGGGSFVADFNSLFAFPMRSHRGSTRFGQK